MSATGFRRTLPAGGVLWWQGDPATSLAVVEQGCLGVRVGGVLLDAAIPGTVLGEAALLTVDADASGRRTADVVALTADSTVVEHPVAGLREAVGEGVPATVLRTLFYQVARNVLLVRAAHPGDGLIAEAAQGLIEMAGRAHARAGGVQTWADFVAAFHLAYRLRESSDAMRAELAPAGTWTSDQARRALDEIRSSGFVSEMASAVEGFVVLWASLPRTDERRSG
jgi:CRP-like cAMP-binding protein